MNVFNLRRLRLTFLLLCLAAVSQFSQGQHMLFHLLAGQPIANFTATSQTVAESVGVWAGWSSNLSAWTRRRQILVDGVSGALTDFPVMIKLDSTRIDYAQVQSAGQDLRFTNDAGTLLSYEIEKWDAAGTSVVWVKVPTLAVYPTKSSIWMYYGNASASDAQSSATWDANHRGVWHLSGNGNDSTSNVNNGTVTGAISAVGQLGNGLSFSSAGDRVQLPDNMMANSSVVTLDGWFKTSSTDVPIFAWTNTTYSTVPASWVPVLYIGTDGKLRGEQYMGAASPITTSGTVNDGSWHHLALVVNSTTQSLYLDGQLVGTLAGTVSVYASMKHYLGLGYQNSWPSTAGGWRTMSGSLDEMRISTNARSADWIQASYRSGRDELATFRSEETPTSGAAIITVQLNTPATTTITIPYTVSGTATAGTDHSRVSGNLTINGGSSSGSLNTYVLRDNLVEGSETAILTLGTPTGASLGPDTVHTVTITDEVLSPPDAVNDSYNLTSLSALTLPVLSNDTDPNGDTLTITSFTTPTSGTLTRVAQQLVYTPSGDFGATDSFTYTISDGRGGTDTATVTINYQIPFTWIGSGANANWTTAANWLGGAVPGASDTAYFNSQCTTYCDPSINGSISVAGIRMNSSFSGTISQNNTNTITIGTSGWTQSAGTFTGGDSAITHNGPFVMNGGTFTSTSGTFTVLNNFTITAGTFNHGGGTLSFDNTSAVQTYYINVPGTVTLQNLRLGGGQSGSGIAKIWNLQTGSFDVVGQFRMGRSNVGSSCSINLYGGTVYVKGNIVLDPANTSYNNPGDYTGGGSATLVVNGTGAQTFAAASAGSLPNVQVNKSSGTFGPADGTANSFMVNSLTLTAGSMTAPSGSLTVNQDFVQSAGTTFTHNSGTLVFDNYGEGSGGGSSSVTTSGTLALNNLTIAGGRPGSSASWTWNLTGASFSVAGNMSLVRTTGTGPLFSNGGSITVAGNISTTTAFAGGTTAITATGTAAQSLSQTASTIIPGTTFTVNKASGTITQTAATAFSTAGQNLTVSSGTYNMAGFSLAVNSTLTVSSGAKLLCNGGTLTYGSASIAGEISCGPSAGITWTGLAGDGLWSTAGNWTNNTIPGASDIAYFNGSCTNCNATVNSAVSVKGIVMTSSYTGTLTQGAGNAMTIGASGWSQAAGTFTGSNAAIAMNGPFALSGGTFTATSATMTTQLGFVLSGSSTFNHNNGTVAFSGAISAVNALTPGSASYYRVTFTGQNTTFNITGTLTVLDLLTVNDTYSSSGLLNTGTIEAKGDISFTNYGKLGSALIRVSGTGNQTITGVLSACIPAFEIASTGGTVTLVGTLEMRKAYTYTSGTVDAGTSTLYFSSGASVVNSVVPGSVQYSNVTFAGYNLYSTITGTMTVNGTLTISDSYSSAGGFIDSGTIVAKGDCIFSSYGKAGTGLIQIAGNSNQTITGVSGAYIPNFEILSTGGVVTLAGTLHFRKNFTYTSGTVDVGTSTAIFDSYVSTNTITPGAMAFYNVTMAGSTGTSTISGTLEALGLLTIAGTGSSPSMTMNSGTILARGDVAYSSYGALGTTNVKVAGSTNQTVSGISAARAPSFEVASTGGTVTYSGTLAFNRSYIHTSGTVDASTSTISIATGSSGAFSFTPGPTTFNDLNLGGYNTVYTMTGTATANGTLTFMSATPAAPSSYNSGAIVANGNVVFSSYGAIGNATLTFGGATNTTVTVGTSASRPSGLVTVNKSGGAKVTMLSDVSFSTAGQDLSISSGTLDLGGYVLSVADVLTVGAGTTLKCSGGSFTNGTLSNSGTINCPGYSTYEFNWTGSGGDSNWNTAANWAGGNVPGAGDTPAFQNTYCGANCNATMNVAVNVRGLQMLSPYTGTITQASGSTVAIGIGGWTQAAGTFSGSNAAISSSGNFALSAGSFTSTSSTLTLSKNFTISGSPTFTHNSGTLVFDSTTATTLTPGAVIFNNVTFAGANTTFTLTGSLYATGTLTLGDTLTGTRQINTGTLVARGNVVFNNNGYGGTAALTFDGTAVSTLDVGASASRPTGLVTVNRTSGGSVTLTSAVSFNGASQDLTITSGTLDMAGYALTIGRNISNSGTLKRGNNPSCGTLSYGGTYSGTAAICP